VRTWQEFVSRPRPIFRPASSTLLRKYSDDQPRDDHGRWTEGGGGGGSAKETGHQFSVKHNGETVHSGNDAAAAHDAFKHHVNMWDKPEAQREAEYNPNHIGSHNVSMEWTNKPRDTSNDPVAKPGGGWVYPSGMSLGSGGSLGQDYDIMLREIISAQRGDARMQRPSIYGS